jgi:hypothetical protein
VAVRSCCILFAALVRAARKVWRGTGPAPGGGQYRDRARNGSFLLTNRGCNGRMEVAAAFGIHNSEKWGESEANWKLIDIRNQALSFSPLLFVYILQYLKGL